ncbi:MAG: SDR family oxidoreductase [Actinomycetes bacterium]
MRFEGKTAIVTGGARGLGETTARLLVAEGANVVVADVLDDLGRSVESAADSMQFVHLDVTDEAAWEDVLSATTTRFGTPDVLVNNAGILYSGSLGDTDLATFQRILTVNLTGAFLGVHIVGREMAAAGRGAIVNVSSIAGMIGIPELGAYAASKWGIRGLTRTAALEFGPSGVRVNSVHPGAIATPMTGATGLDPFAGPPAPGVPDDDPGARAIDASVSWIPIPRAARTIEIARLIAFVASDDASYCTGSEFVADGGYLAGSATPPSGSD